MPTFGIVFCAYNVEPYVHKSLEPFLRPDFEVSAVSVPFAEYSTQEDYRDNTTEILRGYRNSHNQFRIRLVDGPEYIQEHEARNLALQQLPNVDYIWLVDGDEIYTPEQINNIVQFVQDNPAAWYKLCLKNYIFDTDSYMEEPFCPPRIFSTHYNGDFSPRFVWDNDMAYHRIGTNGLVDYRQLTNLTVPQDIAWIDHYSWLNDEIGKRKVEYQQKHFGHCIFKWEDEQLKFDDNYFEKTGEQKPKIIYGK